MKTFDFKSAKETYDYYKEEKIEYNYLYGDLDVSKFII